MNAQMTDEERTNHREWERPENWMGWFGSYSSAADTRLWVPKRAMTGSGLTLNFARPGARAAIAAMCVVPSVLMLVLLLAWLTR
jgi:uncharacterized membrane protein